MSGRDVCVVRRLPAPPDEVFEAWTDPEAMRIWMCPGDIFESVVELDLRVGGRFSINMRSPRGDDVHTGRFVVVDPPRRLSFTWCSRATHHQETLVTLEFRPIGDDSCELVLTHERLPDDQVENHHLGWKAHLRKLFEHLEPRAPGS